MAKVYEPATDDVIEILNAAIKKYHPGLDEHCVRVGVVMVTSEKGDPVTHGGHRCAAKIKRVSRKDRVTTPYEAIIYVDGNLWVDLHEKTRLALLDHELEHLILQFDAPEVIRRDDDGRPLLALKPDDWCLTGFACIVDRHGDFAIEKMSLEKLRSDHGQLLFDFGETLEEERLPEAIGV